MYLHAMFLLVVIVSCLHISVRAAALGEKEAYLAGVGVTRTVGAPWPMPQMHTTSSNRQAVNPREFEFHAAGQSCDVLASAFVRYHRIIFGDGRSPVAASTEDTQGSALKFKPRYQGTFNVVFGKADAANVLTRLNVDVQNPCEMLLPSLEMDESYVLSVSASGGSLVAPSVWGALRGLETFSQLIHMSMDQGLVINETQITDK